MNVIASPSNVKIKRLVRLRDRSREREKTGLFLVEGERLVLDTPAEFLEEIYVTEDARRRLADRLDQKLGEAEKAAGVRRPGCPAERPAGMVPEIVGLSKEVMQKVSDTKTPQGILAVVRQPVWELKDLLGLLSGGVQQNAAPAGSNSAVRTAADQNSAEQNPADQNSAAEGPGIGKAPLLVILEDIQDPGNLGTMFRTAEAAGATGIIMSRNTVDLFNPKTVRATMSSIFRVPFLVTDRLTELIHALQHSTISVYAAMPAERSVTYDQPDYRKPTAFLIGNEGNGLRQETASAADQMITIPMSGRIESLNAAMSAGILLYEAARQRR